MNQGNSTHGQPREKLFHIYPADGFCADILDSPFPGLQQDDDEAMRESAEIMVSRGYAKQEWLEQYDPRLVLTLARNAPLAVAAEQILREQIVSAGLPEHKFSGFRSGSGVGAVPYINDSMKMAFTIPDGSMHNKRRELPYPQMVTDGRESALLQACYWASLYGMPWQREIYRMGFAPIYTLSGLYSSNDRWAIMCVTRQWDGLNVSRIEQMQLRS